MTKLTGVRAILIFALLAAGALAAFAQDDEEICVLPQADIAVEISETQAVVWRVSGGAHIEDASITRYGVPATAKSGAVIYRSPATDEASILWEVEEGGALSIVGRSADRQWLYVSVPENTDGETAGWIAAKDATVIGIIALLPVVDPEHLPLLVPFQAVNIPPESCVASEIAGGLVQSSGEDGALIIANGIEILLEGTAFVRPVDDTLTISVLDGHAIASGDIFIPAGASAVITPDAEPEIVPYDGELFSALPLTEAAGSPFVTVEIAPALAASEIEAAVAALSAP